MDMGVPYAHQHLLLQGSVCFWWRSFDGLGYFGVCQCIRKLRNCSTTGGQLYSALFLAALAGQRVHFTNLASFQVSLFEVEEDQQNITYCGNLIILWVVVGTGDDEEPVITVGFPEDF